MSIIFDPADRGQNNAARGGAQAAPAGRTSRLGAQRRGLNPTSGTQGSAVSSGNQPMPRRPTWRYDVNTPEEFQKFVQLSSQGAVIFALYAPHSPSSADA